MEETTKGENSINSMTEEGETRLENDNNNDGDENVGLRRLTNEIDDDK